jgi:3,4-dihydroxy-2-butanone 4-phosphate synthase
VSFDKFKSTTAEIIEEAKRGRMFVLVDDEERENEGDIVVPAQMATPEAVNFMAKHGRGLICLALERQRVEALGLPLMSLRNGTRPPSPSRSRRATASPPASRHSTAPAPSRSPSTRKRVRPTS